VKAILVSAAMILMLAAPAYAQSKEEVPTPDQMMGGKTPDVIEKEKAADRAYKESLKKIPDAKASTDPWGNTRTAEPVRTGAKAGTKAATKTGTKAAAAKKPAAKSGTAN
jgi:hypothetical protein